MRPTPFPALITAARAAASHSPCRPARPPTRPPTRLVLDLQLLPPAAQVAQQAVVGRSIDGAEYGCGQGGSRWGWERQGNPPGGCACAPRACVVGVGEQLEHDGGGQRQRGARLQGAGVAGAAPGAGGEGGRVRRVPPTVRHSRTHRPRVRATWPQNAMLHLKVISRCCAAHSAAPARAAAAAAASGGAAGSGRGGMATGYPAFAPGVRQQFCSCPEVGSCRFELGQHLFRGVPHLTHTRLGTGVPAQAEPGKAGLVCNISGLPSPGSHPAAACLSTPSTLGWPHTQEIHTQPCSWTHTPQGWGGGWGGGRARRAPLPPAPPAAAARPPQCSTATGRSQWWAV